MKYLEINLICVNVVILLAGKQLNVPYETSERVD